MHRTHRRFEHPTRRTPVRAIARTLPRPDAAAKSRLRLALLLAAGTVAWLAIAMSAHAAGQAAAAPASTSSAAAAPAAQAAASAPAKGPQVTEVSQQQLLAQQAQHDKNLFLLDVRTPQEFAEGHIAGAVNIPHDQLATKLAEVPKDKEVVLYCRSGRRAGMAAEVLAANGYKRLAHLEGDMNAWVANGRPVAK